MESRPECVRRRYDRSETMPSVAVVDAIASLEGLGQTDVQGQLGIVLYDYVDTDALDTILAPGTSIEVSFPVDDYAVRIDEGTVRVSRVSGDEA